MDLYKYSHVTHLCKNLDLLKLNDIYKLELANFMHKIYNNELPQLFKIALSKLNKSTHMIPDELKNATIFYLELANLFVKTHCLFVEPNFGAK